MFSNTLGIHFVSIVFLDNILELSLIVRSTVPLRNFFLFPWIFRRYSYHCIKRERNQLSICFDLVQADGMSILCSGSHDPSSPKRTMWKTVPHRLLFGRASTPCWGTGGVAFLNPEINYNEKSYICMYKITYVLIL